MTGPEMTLKACLEELLSCTDEGAAVEAWEKVVQAADETIKSQPQDALTLKLLLTVLPDFLTNSFSTLPGQSHQST